MPGFQGGPNFATPFGRNVFLRSTKDLKTLSYMAAASAVTSETIDTWPNQKMLQTGTVMARITSGADAGKVGPFQPAGGQGTQTVTVTGAPTGGTFALDLDGEVTAPIAYNATAAAVQAALEALPTVAAAGADVVATGGPLPATAVTLTWQTAGAYGRGGSPVLSVVEAALTGGTTPAAAVATTGAGTASAGATDGRQDWHNIVGVNNTFLPWQFAFRDVEIAVVTDALVVADWLLMYDGNGARTVFDKSVITQLVSGQGDPSLNLRFV